jgi:outer membrane immunogenic protein
MSARKFLMVASATTGLMAACGGAYAADAVAPEFDWSGFYVGGYAGVHFSDTSVSDPLGVDPRFKSDVTGFVGGGLIGANHQIDRIVLGIEGEAGFTDFKKRGRFFDGDGAGEAPDPFREKSQFVGRVRGRIGFDVGSLSVGNALFFAAGGVSFLPDHKLTLSDDAVFTSISKDYTGFNVGGGMEIAVTNNWIFRAEYIYDDYGSQKYGFAAIDPELSNRRVKITDNTVRGAIEFKF